MERIENEQARTLGQMEENWDQVQHQLDVFTQHNTKAEKLLACTDDITFLEVYTHTSRVVRAVHIH